MQPTLSRRQTRARLLENQAVSDAEIFLKSAERAPLVNIANIPSAYKTTGKSHKKNVEKLILRAVARKLLVDANMLTKKGNKHRTRTCGMHKARGADGITIKLNSKRLKSSASIGGTQTCTCLWGCPVCYENIAMEKAQDIYTAIQWANANNHACVMVALTASHSKHMPLVLSKSSFKEAWDTFNGHRRWKKFKKDFGVSHVIHNSDTTHGDLNGWHYHKHVLLLIDKDKTNAQAAHDEINDILTELWLSSLKNNKRDATAEHGLHVSTHAKASSEYLAKIGITVQDDGKLHYEMTSSEDKNSRTIWDILRHARYGDKESEKLYLEYVRAFTGDNWMSFGRSGLQKIIKEFVPEKTDADEKSKDVKRHWLKFSDYWWDIVKWSEGHARIVDVAAKTRSINDVRALLFLMRWELAKEQKLSEYFLKYAPEKNSIADMRIHEDWINENLFSDSS